MSVEHRVVGPPGCGKTTYLTRQCNVAAEKYGGGGVAVASLTRTAAREVAGRETKVPVQNIGTLHAHAYRKLGHPALALDREGVKDWNAKCGNPAWKLSAKQIAGSPENDAPMEMAMVDDGGDELLAEVQMLRAKMVDERLWSHRVLSFWKAWEDWKAQAGRLDFTDLVEEAIAKVPNLEVSVVMLDEAQDMSALEMTLARQWGEEAEQFVVVGDPDQNLFSWRGSDPEAFYAVEAQTTRVLSQSYRVPKAVHEAAVRWIERIPGRVPVEYEPTEREGKVVRHEMVGLDDAERIVRMIDGMRQDGSSVMLLASCGYMLNPVLAALRTAAIPFHNPYRVTNGAWNPMRGGERLLALMRPRNEVWGDEARLWTWDEVWKWVQPMRVEGVLKRGAKQLIQGKVKARGRFDEPEIVDLHTLLELFHEEHREAVFSMDVAWWQGHLLHAHTKPQKYPRDMALLHGGAILRERPKVIVGTIHSVKGGEADKVILAPDLSRSGEEQWMSPDKQGPAFRMFYVGMTRAREELHLLGPSQPGFVSL